MSEFLIISNPPQPPGDLSHVAREFDITAAELRMKANYPIPEIWFAGANETELKTTADSLTEAGLAIVLASDHRLGAVPEQARVESFTFEEESLALQWDGEQVKIPYDASLSAVVCQPRREASLEDLRRGGDALQSRMAHSATMAGGRGRSSLAVQQATDESLEGKGFIDIYLQHSGTTQRLGIVEGVADFGGLEAPLRRAADNLALFVDACAARMVNGYIDRRCVGMRTRKRFHVSGKPQPVAGMRKGFSFATAALSQLLAATSPRLADAGQGDLCSRLVYLTLSS